MYDYAQCTLSIFFAQCAANGRLPRARFPLSRFDSAACYPRYSRAGTAAQGVYMAMDEKIAGAFEYAFETENGQLFDSLAAVFAADKQEAKDELLLLAAKKAKTPALVEQAIALGGNLHLTDEHGATLLHHAAASCSRKTIKTLFHAGADIHVKNKRGESLLMLAAAHNGYTGITRFFLEQGLSVADRSNDGCTALLLAARWQQNTDVLDALVSAGSDLYARAANGDTAFHLAAMNWHPYAAEWLTKHFSTSEKNDAGETCLERALSAASSGATLGVYLQKMRHEQLLRALQNHSYGIIEKLVHAGYDLNAADGNGTTALMLAAKGTHSWRYDVQTTLDDLLAHGANRDDAVEVAVTRTQWYDSVHLLDDLLSLGADCERKDGKQRNVLHYAAANADAEVYDMACNLLGGCNGTLANAKDCFGHTPAYYCDHKDEF